MRRALILIVMIACTGGEHRDARDRYNAGVAALGEQKYEDAEKAFSDAINDAGVDPELRGRAAFDLGVAYAEHAKQAQGAQPPDADKALDLLHQAAAWFDDAYRLDRDPDAKTNVAIVNARAQALADEVNKGKNGLQPRLERLIDGQRKVRDTVQSLWEQVVAAGASADPTAQRDTYDAAATAERTLLAEAGTISDMAGDEISAIGAKPEDQRKDEEKARLVQLKNLDLYVQDARTALSDARRQLHGLDGDEARKSAESALEALKRAREQLLDPITVLQELGREEMELGEDTYAAATAAKDAMKIGGSSEKAAPVKSPAVLAERQGRVKDRIDEVVARLKAGVEHEDQAKDEQAKKVLEQIKAALPSVDAASGAMGKAKDALAATRLDDGLADERDAVVAIARAIEQFSDLKHLIELAWSDQGAVVELMTKPPADVKPDERARQVEDRVKSNVDRLGRMQQMIADEVAKASQPPPAQPGQPAQPPDPKQVEAMKAQLAKAEELRQQALAAETELARRLDAQTGAHAGDPLQPANEALDKLTELRKLFFSLIEHLQQLIADQGQTRDDTATARQDDDDARAAKLPKLAGRQAEHTGLAQEIADALAKAADEAAQKAQQGAQPQQQPGQPDAKALADAEGEMRGAVDSMQGAGTAFTEAEKQSQTASVDLQPTLDAQAQALEHLQNALRLLQPPPPPKQDQKDQKQDQQKQDQQKQDQQQQQQQQKQQDDASAQEAQRRAQEVRDNEAKRQRERQERQRMEPEPVDKDW